MASLTEKRLQELTRKKLKGTITEAENTVLEAWYERQPPERLTWRSYHVDKQALHARIFEAICKKANINTEITIPHERRRIPWLRYAAAIVIFGIGACFYLNAIHERKSNEIAEMVQKISLPGKSGAVLTLGNGDQLLLDSAGNGRVAAQNGVNVLQQGNRLSYIPAQHSLRIAYNTLSTPKGVQFQLILPDGSKVWLNAASSIKYPVAFSGKERKVKITGEVYFEIAKNEQMPFRVDIGNDAEIDVLGTRFNVKAYEDEGKVNITLLEGSIKVQKTNKAAPSVAIIKPGQQAQLDMNSITNDSISIINEANINTITAWKNGMFSFSRADIQTIMLEVARWYNVDVVYSGNITERFHVEVNRDTKISDIFKILAGTGKVQFKIEGRQITVMP